jgi:hypothetical protein
MKDVLAYEMCESTNNGWIINAKKPTGCNPWAWDFGKSVICLGNNLTFNLSFV